MKTESLTKTIEVNRLTRILEELHGKVEGSSPEELAEVNLRISLVEDNINILKGNIRVH